MNSILHLNITTEYTMTLPRIEELKARHSNESGNHLLPGRRMSITRSTSAHSLNKKSEVDDFELFCAQAGTSSPLPVRKISGSDEYGGSMPCLIRNHSVKVPKPKRDAIHLKYTLSLPTSSPLKRHNAVDQGSKDELHSPRGSAPGSPARTPSVRRKKGIFSSIRNMLTEAGIDNNKPEEERTSQSQDNSISGCRSAPHSRQGSVRRPRKPRVNQEVNGIRRRTNSMPIRKRPRTLHLNPESAHLTCTPVFDDNTRIRNFEITSKGIINRGDSFRSRSPSSLRSWGSSGSAVGEDSTAGDFEDLQHRVVIMGASGVGKTTLAQQFLSSDNVTELDTIEDDLNIIKVSVMVDNKQKTLEFVDLAANADHTDVPLVDAYIIVYATDDRATYHKALKVMAGFNSKIRKEKPIIVVANKTDLVRTREVSKKEGKLAAEAHKVKFIEVSASMNLQIDELLVGVITQIRLRQDRMRARRNEGRSTLASISRFLRRQGSKFSKSSEDLQRL